MSEHIELSTIDGVLYVVSVNHDTGEDSGKLLGIEYIENSLY